MRQRVVITGIGPVTSIGAGKREYWESLLKGRSGISRIEAFDTSDYDTKIGGEIKGFDLKAHVPKVNGAKLDRFVQFGLAAAKLAIDDSGLDLDKVRKDRVGVYIGSGIGGMLFYEKQVEMMHHYHSSKHVHPIAVSKITPNAISSNISAFFGFTGPNVTISTACSSSNHAIGLALDAIRMGKADIAITGGAEASIIPVNFASFDNMRAMSRKNEKPEEASRPFDRGRDGFVMGEGAGMLVIETLENALKRKANIYAELIGYGSSSGAFHMVMPMIGGEDAALAIEAAIKDAKINKDDIGYVNAHGTSTAANDISETHAIKKVFGDSAYRMSVSSTKSMIGHLIGAAGAIGVITSALSLKEGVLTPTINYRTKDPECDLDYVPNEARKKSVKAALVNSFGFGNNNACVILKKYKR